MGWGQEDPCVAAGSAVPRSGPCPHPSRAGRRGPPRRPSLSRPLPALPALAVVQAATFRGIRSDPPRPGLGGSCHPSLLGKARHPVSSAFENADKGSAAPHPACPGPSWGLRGAGGTCRLIPGLFTCSLAPSPGTSGVRPGGEARKLPPGVADRERGFAGWAPLFPFRPPLFPPGDPKAQRGTAAAQGHRAHGERPGHFVLGLQWSRGSVIVGHCLLGAAREPPPCSQGLSVVAPPAWMPAPHSQDLMEGASGTERDAGSGNVISIATYLSWFPWCRRWLGSFRNAFENLRKFQFC